MKLLVITQKVDIDDDNLGFFHHWLEKLAEKSEKLYVICLWQGRSELPSNVTVLSLGKEKGYSKFRQFLRLQKFLLNYIKDADGIFVHMCPIYAILSFPLAKIFRKKMLLWYVHKSVNWELRLAEKLVDKILTASIESCRLKNRKKIEVVGHGIDSGLFKPRYNSNGTNYYANAPNKKFKILSTGRISPIKDQKTLIEAVDILVNEKNFKALELEFIGSPVEDYEKEYLEKLKNLVKEKKLENYITFLQGISFNGMPGYYQDADLVVNLSHTGSIDKVVLEAMACERPVLTCNEAFTDILDNKYLFRKKDPRDLAEKMINLREVGKDERLREIVVKNHNLDNLIDKIISEFY